MGRKQKKYHYIYKTTCNVTRRYYIGMHSTDNLDDGYMGSGKRLRYSIRKHGNDNHIKEILEYCDSREELKAREEEIINSNLIKEINCMNLVIGGGGFMLDDYHYECSKVGNNKLNEKLNNDPTFRENWLNKMTVGVQKAMDDGKMKTWKDNYDWTDKKHSEETKQKIGETMKGKGKGSDNSQFGKCWITNDNDNKKIFRGDAIPDGWRLGRKMK